MEVGENKSVSPIDITAEHFIIHPNTFKHLQRSQHYFKQYAVDMYRKIESERLGYIMRKQKELKFVEYAHLKDTVNNDAPGTELG